jgi:Xaa-Pro aminopeptidase
MFNLSEMKQRRRRLLATLDKEVAVILVSAAEHFRNGDVHYPYRQDSDFYYLTAFPEPSAIAVLLPDSTQEEKFILFNRPYDPVEAMWNGQAIGQEKAKEVYAVDEAYAISELEVRLPEFLADRRVCYYLGSQNPVFIKRLDDILAKINKLPSQEGLVDLAHSLHEMRLIKGSYELDCLRQASKISSQAHVSVMQACHPGAYEYQLEAELLYKFYQANCRATAYPSIVASGANACILHYVDNNAILQSGDLVLIDAGCEYQSYASDITRTFPINGRFSPEQRAIYDVVLATQKKLIALIKPGLAWDSLQSECIRLITEGLVDLGLLKGKVDDLIEQKHYKKFYMHSCSHWLGLDVHDVGCYKRDKKWRPLEVNMVFTVEPGIYISPSTDVDEKWWNIGVRIEDDVRVTEMGCELFSVAPKEIADIESLMRA